jgi:hypothetical protein
MVLLSCTVSTIFHASASLRCALPPRSLDEFTETIAKFYDGTGSQARRIWYTGDAWKIGHAKDGDSQGYTSEPTGDGRPHEADWTKCEDGTLTVQSHEGPPEIGMFR